LPKTAGLSIAVPPDDPDTLSPFNVKRHILERPETFYRRFLMKDLQWHALRELTFRIAEGEMFFLLSADSIFLAGIFDADSRMIG
jgi:hypothetical protein